MVAELPLRLQGLTADFPLLTGSRHGHERNCRPIRMVVPAALYDAARDPVPRGIPCRMRNHVLREHDAAWGCWVLLDRATVSGIRFRAAASGILDRNRTAHLNL